MKPIHLHSLVESYHSLSEEDFKDYLQFFGITFDKDEVTCISKLLLHIGNATVDDLSDFYVGFNIQQINKEFDLLRFGTNEIINIEVKRKGTPERIEKQLKQNRYYLSFLGKTVHSFTYLSESDKVYQYDHKDNLIESNVQTLSSILQRQDIEQVDDVNQLFKPSNYLVSPFNSTDKFIEGEYFLTQHQESIKKDLNDRFDCLGSVFASIVGVPGTGKTLLTYDIAKEYIEKGFTVRIIHCANLNEGHNKLNALDRWRIIPIKSISQISNSYFDVLIVDEAQRLRESQLDIIIESIQKYHAKCIFSYDPEQCFTHEETIRNISAVIEEKHSSRIHTLTKKIRTNKEISSFIIGFFNLNKVRCGQDYPNIHIQYFDRDSSVKQYALSLSNNGWDIINFTKSQFYELSYDKYQHTDHKNSHVVIGQEYDKVAVFIDEHFYYDEEKRLRGSNVQGGAYSIDKMLYQNLTRTREKLTLIIVRNKSILREIQSNLLAGKRNPILA